MSSYHQVNSSWTSCSWRENILSHRAHATEIVLGDELKSVTAHCLITAMLWRSLGKKAKKCANTTELHHLN